jgi:DNA-directed RNA polymerase subunit RPC12/RpoP
MGNPGHNGYSDILHDEKEKKRRLFTEAQTKGRQRSALDTEPATIIFVCRNCEKKFKVTIVDLQGGMVITCMKCGEEIVQTLPSDFEEGD